MEIPFLRDLVVVFATAVAVATVSRFARLPSVAGFLLTGVIIGPSALGLVHDRHLVEVLAEIGVMALLFTIGLEFSPERLRRLGRAFLVGGVVQAVATIAAGTLLGRLLGYPAGDALFLGFLLTLSSTAIVLKLYGDRREIDSPQGRAAVGILLFQDFLIVPMIIITPALAGGGGGGSLGEALLRMLIGVAVLGVLFAVSRLLLPHLFRQIVKTRIREILLLGAIAVGLGMALLTSSFGFSLALGAFVAGLLLAESEYSPQVTADILPLRDVFNSLFFISAGMLLSVSFVARNPLLVAGVSVAIILVKGTICFIAVRLLAYPNRTALVAGASLAQVGEFSFVLISVGLANGLLDETVNQTFLAAAVVTMLATPMMVAMAPVLAMRLRPPAIGESETEAASLPREGHVIIVGYGVNGENLARVLRQAGIDYLILELNGDTVARARAAGEPILYGDAVRPEILELAGIEGAEVAVFAIPDRDAVRRAVRLSRGLNPHLHIVVRTANVDEIDEVHASGASEVVAAEYEAAIEVVTRVLRRYDVPDNVIDAERRVLHGDDYRLLRAPDADFSEELVAALTAGTTAVFGVIAGSAAAGRSIRELDLRRRTGATIVALVRDLESHPSPSADLVVQEGDRLVLVGGHAEIRAAFESLG